MPRPFISPEAALRFAYGIREVRLESKCATQRAYEILREAAGLGAAPDASEYTPSEHLAHGTMIVTLVDRELASRPVLLAIIRAEYSARVEGALGIQEVSEHIKPDVTGGERLLADWFVTRQCRGVPALRKLADMVDLSPATLSRRERPWRYQVGQLRKQAIDAVTRPLEHAGIIIATRERETA